MDFTIMDRRELLQWILGGLGTDGSRWEASFELFWRFGCSDSRRRQLLNRGWWAARAKHNDGLAF